jgi:hypothetical protein
MNTQRAILGVLGGVGAATFAFFFALTVRTPEWLERYASDFIEREAGKQIDERVDSFQPISGESALSRMATGLAQKNENDIARYKESLKQQAHERMADAIAEIRNLDCECRAKWAQWLKEGTENQILLLQQANASLTDFIHATYAQVVEQLKRDVRIFTAANAAMFLLVLAIALAKPQASLQLFVPGLLLTVATTLCSYFYVFEQNWLLTIIYNDYLGYAYLAYLGLVFGFLCDIALNRARVTTEVVNTTLNAMGSAATAVPC